MSATKFEGVTPILPVEDLKASLRYYVSKLGFKIDWQGPGIFASVSRPFGEWLDMKGNAWSKTADGRWKRQRRVRHRRGRPLA